MLKLWVDHACPQMSVAKVVNCWLQDSYPTAVPRLPPLSHRISSYIQLAEYSSARRHPDAISARSFYVQ